MADNTVTRTEEYSNYTMIVENINEYSYIIWKEWTTDLLAILCDFTNHMKPDDIMYLPKWVIIT